ncbi:MAG: hypothetical protein OR999_08950 [Arenicellales bacterium]|nr:hypothetical protein [Arenicellales bacterium]
MELLWRDRQLEEDRTFRLLGEVVGLQMAQPAQSAQKLHRCDLRRSVGALADADATRDRGVMAANRSTKPASARMKLSNKNPNMIEVLLARIPEECPVR